MGELLDHQPDCRIRQMDLVSAFSYSRVSRQASAIDNATPLGLQAGIDDHARVAEAAAMGAFGFGHE